MTTLDVLSEILAERDAQDAKWGEQNHPDLGFPAIADSTRRRYAEMANFWKRENDVRVDRGGLAWDGILLEEVFEALAEDDPAKLRTELVQVAAVATAQIEAIDRRTA